MASEKISQLTPHTPNAADLIPVADGGVNFSDTVGQIETAAAALVHWSALLGNLTETQVIPFDGPTPGTADTGLSRGAASTIYVGNGAAADFSGSLRLASFTAGPIPSTIPEIVAKGVDYPAIDYLTAVIPNGGISSGFGVALNINAYCADTSSYVGGMNSGVIGANPYGVTYESVINASNGTAYGTWGSAYNYDSTITGTTLVGLYAQSGPFQGGTCAESVGVQAWGGAFGTGVTTGVGLDVIGAAADPSTGTAIGIWIESSSTYFGVSGHKTYAIKCDDPAQVAFNGVVGWQNAGLTAIDTGLSRGGAGAVYVGNGTAGDYSGSLKLTSLNVVGSITTPILEANNTINVMYYGATGNGSTDDTTAINAAIAAITSTKAVLYFPAGTYVVSSTLTLAAPVRVVGDSQASTIVFLKASSNCNVFAVTSSNVSFEQLKVDGNSANNTGNIFGISYATTLSNFTLKSVSVINCGNGVIMLSDSNVLVDGCAFSGSLGSQFGYEFTVGVASSNVTIVNSLFDSTGVTSPYVNLYMWPASTTGSVSNVLISNNVITFPQTGATESDGIVIIGQSATLSSDVVISNNVISSPAGSHVGGNAGIEIAYLNGIVISNNTFTNQHVGIVTYYAITSNLSIVGNTLTGSGAANTLAISLTATTSVTNANVIGNTISAYASGIILSKCLQSVVSNNTISLANLNGSGINIANCADLAVDNNTIVTLNGNTFCIVSTGTTETNETYRGNVIKGGSIYAFLFYGTTYTNCVLQGNTIDGIANPYTTAGAVPAGVFIIDDNGGTLSIEGGNIQVESIVGASIANSPSLLLSGVYEATSGPTYAADTWSFTVVEGTGVKGTSTLQIYQSGTTGTASIAVPNGTIAQPGYSFNGNTASGMYLNATTGNPAIASYGTPIVDFGGAAEAHLAIPSSSVFAWCSTAALTATQDTGLSRGGTGAVYVGNGTAGNASGTLNCATLIEGSTLTPASATTAGVTGQIAWQGTNGTTGQIFICTSGGVAGSAIWMAATLAKV